LKYFLADKGKDSFTDEGFEYNAEKIEKEKLYVPMCLLQMMILDAVLLLRKKFI
jgi:hypothetical protein